MRVPERLKSLGYELPAPVAAVANYAPYLIAGDKIYISGQIPVRNGALTCQGAVGEAVTQDEAIEAARLCALNILGQVNQAVHGDWESLKRCLKLGGYVSSGPDFTDHSKIINGASDLIVSVFGEAGKHTRFAVGASSLPMGASVEVDAIFQLARRATVRHTAE